MPHLKSETLANIATTIVAGLLSIALVKTYLLPARPPRNPSIAPAVIATGTDLKGKVPVDWSRNRHTLILAISTHCHFCTESAPFFRKLQQEVGQDFKIVAILPEPVAEAEQYLEETGVRVDEVKQVSLGGIGVRGTPTMLLVNAAGAVTQSWVGRLEPKQQDEALSTLRQLVPTRQTPSAGKG